MARLASVEGFSDMECPAILLGYMYNDLARCAVALNNASRFMPAESAAPTASAMSSTDITFRDRLLAINTPALADANKEGLRVMDHRLRPLNKNPIQFAGIARTVRCYNDFLTVRAVATDLFTLLPSHVA